MVKQCDIADVKGSFVPAQGSRLLTSRLHAQIRKANQVRIRQDSTAIHGIAQRQPTDSQLSGLHQLAQT